MSILPLSDIITDPNDRSELEEIGDKRKLMHYLRGKYGVPHNVVFMQGLFLECKMQRLYEKCLEIARCKENEPVTFFETYTPIKGT